MQTDAFFEQKTVEKKPPSNIALSNWQHVLFSNKKMNMWQKFKKNYKLSS